MTHTCAYCDYYTERKYNLIRHTNTRHKIQNEHAEQKPIIDEENPFIVGENPFIESEKPFIVDSNTSFKCSTCYKSYSTKRGLDYHTPKCKNIQSCLECDKCHRVFASSGNLARHKHKCASKAVSEGLTHNTSASTSHVSLSHNNTSTTNNIHFLRTCIPGQFYPIITESLPNDKRKLFRDKIKRRLVQRREIKPIQLDLIEVHSP